MNAEQISDLIEAIALLIQATGWPLLVLFLVIYFSIPLKKFMSDVGEFTFKAGASGLEATAKRQQIEAAALLGAASTKPSEGDNTPREFDENQAREIANVVANSKVRQLAGALVLWVDDNPSNTIYERSALEALGLRFTLSTSTDDALVNIRANRYAVIISDMGRPPDNRAGYTLLSEIRKLGYNIPYIIYASSNLPQHKTEARQKGALGSTNKPQELFQLVLSAVERM